MMAPEAPLRLGFAAGVTVLMVDARRLRVGAATIGAGAARARPAIDATRERSVN